MAVGVAFGKKLRQGQIHRAGNFGERVEGGDRVAIFDAREIAAQESGALFDITLGHASLEAVAANGLADVHSLQVNNPRKSWLHSNQCGTFWQVEIGTGHFGQSTNG